MIGHSVPDLDAVLHILERVLEFTGVLFVDIGWIDAVIECRRRGHRVQLVDLIAGNGLLPLDRRNGSVLVEQSFLRNGNSAVLAAVSIYAKGSFLEPHEACADRQILRNRTEIGEQCSVRAAASRFVAAEDILRIMRLQQRNDRSVRHVGDFPVGNDLSVIQTPHFAVVCLRNRNGAVRAAFAVFEVEDRIPVVLISIPPEDALLIVVLTLTGVQQLREALVCHIVLLQSLDVFQRDIRSGPFIPDFVLGVGIAFFQRETVVDRVGTGIVSAQSPAVTVAAGFAGIVAVVDVHAAVAGANAADRRVVIDTADFSRVITVDDMAFAAGVSHDTADTLGVRTGDFRVVCAVLHEYAVLIIPYIAGLSDDAADLPSGVDRSFQRKIFYGRRPVFLQFLNGKRASECIHLILIDDISHISDEPDRHGVGVPAVRGPVALDRDRMPAAVEDAVEIRLDHMGVSLAGFVIHIHASVRVAHGVLAADRHVVGRGHIQISCDLHGLAHEIMLTGGFVAHASRAATACAREGEIIDLHALDIRQLRGSSRVLFNGLVVTAVDQRSQSGQLGACIDREIRFRRVIP